MAKNFILWVVIAAVLMAIFNNFEQTTTQERVSYSAFINDVETGRVAKVVISGYTIEGTRTNNSSFVTERPYGVDSNLSEVLMQNSVSIEGKAPEQESVWTQ